MLYDEHYYYKNIYKLFRKQITIWMAKLTDLLYSFHNEIEISNREENIWYPC